MQKATHPFLLRYATIRDAITPPPGVTCIYGFSYRQPLFPISSFDFAFKYKATNHHPSNCTLFYLPKVQKTKYQKYRPVDAPNFATVHDFVSVQK